MTDVIDNGVVDDVMMTWWMTWVMPIYDYTEGGVGPYAPGWG